jgi:hypothetical protein
MLNSNTLNILNNFIQFLKKCEICISGIATFRKKTASPHSQEEERGREHG